MPLPQTSGRPFIAYYRVSTGKQDRYGLSLEAQQTDVRGFVASMQGQMVAEFSETRSGLKANRPVLSKALGWCRITKATLVIARLDRLARSLELISSILESGLEFVALDAPHANKFTLHILAALAEYESKLISARTKAAMAAAKARGDQRIRRPFIFRPLPPSSYELSAKVRRQHMEQRASDLAPLIWKARREGRSYTLIADEFNREGIAPPRSAPWTAKSIGVIARSTRDDYSKDQTELPSTRIGWAQFRVKRQSDQVGQLLLDLWRSKATYLDMRDELFRRGIPSPWGRMWGKASIRRYLIRTLGVSLREARGLAPWPY